MPQLIDKSSEQTNLNQVPASRGDNPIEWIVVHYLGVENADNEYLYGGGYGGHFYVSRAGEVYKAADPRSAVTWHCGGGLQGYDPGSATYHNICTNYNSIGIENGVCFDSDWYFTTETQESLVWLVNNLMSEYGIDKDHVIRHWDVTGKNCPAPYVANNRHNTSWTWDEFKSKLNGVSSGSGFSGGSTTNTTTGMSGGYIDPSMLSPAGLVNPTPLYTTSSTRADAMMREVCYLGEDGEPSINKTDIKLSVINYTDLLAEFYGLFGFTPSTAVGSGYAATEVVIDNIEKLRSVHRKIVEFLWDKDFNTAAAIGVIANIEDENKCTTSAIKNNIEFGLCRWTWGRAIRMKAHCNGTWRTNLTGQLEFMIDELETAYKSTLDSIKKVDNTDIGAKKAMRLFYNGYIRKDKPKGTSRVFDYKVREKIVMQLWEKVVIGQTVYRYSYGGTTSYEDKTHVSTTPSVSTGNATISGRTAVKTVVVPSILGGAYPEQTGIIGDTTRFDYFFDRWKYTCRVIADKWHAQGRPSNHHVCMLDGYYLVAVAPMFGVTGDLIQVVLEDGTAINCVCGDTKGSDKQSDYGHVFSGKVSIVEWESCNIQTDNEGAEMNQYLTEWGIYKKKVKQITNYGVYIS